MEQAVPFHAHHTRQWVQHIGDKLNRICAVMDCAWNHRLRIEKQCCGLCLQWSPFPSPAPNDHTEIRCFDNHRQSKRCVRNPKLRTMVGPANPVPCELRDPFADYTKENNIFGSINAEPMHAKGVQNVSKISKGTVAISDASAMLFKLHRR